jgi:signal transduction histidine kinase
MLPSAPHPEGLDKYLDSVAGGNEMAARIRSFDWAATPLGPMNSWSPALRMMVRFLLANRFPLLLWWGPQYVSIYNDAYRPVLGAKHPWALGTLASDCWGEIWHILQPLVDTPYNGGPATWNDDICLEVNRHGFVEETHFTIAYSPVPDEAVPSRIGGVLATVHEITEKVIGERRILALRDLGATAGEAKTAEEACTTTGRTLARHPKDVPFSLIYLLGGEGNRHARLAGYSGVAAGQDISAFAVDLRDEKGNGWPLSEAKETGTIQIVDQLGARFAGLPSGPWSDPPNAAAVVPVFASKGHEVAGLLVAGISSRLRWDESYRAFIELVSSQVATAIVNARAYEEEKKRAEALAELDRAKTTFFSNVSHEFRTPLTLILAPLQDALADVREPQQRERLELIHRNGLRLQKLVNTLLDFSRIEAGRVRASFQATDITSLTGELASVFRSAIERAGMRLLVNCQSINDPIFVDREMYEKIVLNLLSNAFKFTLRGEIEVRLEDEDQAIKLYVRDTGSGIAQENLPHIFERFRRVEGQTARTYEGTGIGLALVHELVNLHGGSVSVASVIGQGSEFCVTLPKGKTHLPADQIRIGTEPESSALKADHFLQEALRWLGDKGPSLLDSGPALVPEIQSAPTPAGGRPRVVWADDNTDMRDYVRRLLGSQYEVEAYADGESALAGIRRDLPDLVLADIMMPRRDGFDLLRAIRMDERMRSTPVILLSARAGEEARLEALQAGADDYLIKPFTARELIGSVEAHLKLSRLRRQAEDALLEADRRKNEFLAILAHELRNPLAPLRTALYTLRMPGFDQKFINQTYEIMERQVTQLVRLIDDLMEVSRITIGKIELRRVRVKVEDIMADAIEVSKSLIDAANHQLYVDVPSERLVIDGDPVRLTQILSNLLNNAAKYTNEKGQIWMKCYRDGGFVVFSVRDNGIGIPSEMLPRVFELFTQVGRSYSRSQGGLGIGLTLASRLVEMHGGTIEAKSPGSGLGSEFVVRLPLAPDITTHPEKKPTNELSSGEIARRILVVDDNRDSADSLSIFLKLMKAEVATANSGLEALEILETIDPSVVILDIGMPGIDGFELARRIRQQRSSQDITLIALSGWGYEEDRLRSKQAGIDYHLVKPVDFVVLRNLLARLPEKP